MRSSLLKSGFDLCGVISAVSWLALVKLPSLRPGPVEPALFLTCLGLAWLGLIGAYFCASRTGTITFQRLLFWAVIFRVVAWFGSPLYDDDYTRFLWDGRAFAEEGSPYQHAPAESFGRADLPSADQWILDRINQPQWLSTASPIVQFLSLASYTLAPSQTWPLKLFLTCADFFVLMVLMQWVPPRQSLLYAWCPLLLFETYFHLHTELFSIVLILLAMLHLSRRQHTPASVASVLAVGAHPFALFPTLWIASKSKLWAWIVALSTFGLVYGYFIFHDGWKVFSGEWEWFTHVEFNSLAYGLTSAYLPPLLAHYLCASLLVIFLVVWLTHYQGHSIELPRFDWFFIALFLCAPAVYPSFFLWLIPWVVVRPKAWNLAALMLISLSYCYGQNLANSTLAPYAHPSWVRPVEVGGVAAVGFGEWLLGLWQTRNGGNRFRSGW